MTATPVSKEEVRLLAIEYGVREAARRLGLSEDRVRQWSSRYNWFKTSPKVQTVTSVTKPSEIIQNDLAEHEKETRLSLARSARRMAKDAEQCTLRDADKALKVGQLAGIVHKWNDGNKGESFSLNVLNMGALEVRVGKEIAEHDQP